MAWNPRQYERFQAARLRPGLDLMAALPSLQPERVVDLGCGTGVLTRRLADLHPMAQVIGLDSSTAMLARAAREPSRVTWEAGDIARWHPPGPVDLIFSNAALHWLPGHDGLFARLIGALTPGGVLAVQMPRNFASPSHRLLRETAAEGVWAARLNGIFREEPVHPPEWYWRCLAPLCGHVEIWETDYLHALDGPDPVLEWVKGTALLPVMEALRGAELDGFLAAYAARLRDAYPPEPSGITLFPFRRLFVIAQARDEIH